MPIARLAKILRTVSTMRIAGVPLDPNDDYPDRMWSIGSDADRAEWVDAARRVLANIGLVAIDSALVERLRTTRARAEDPVIPNDGTYDCDAIHDEHQAARAAVLDAALAQLTPRAR